MQQRVEILKALYRGADTLILDEPTAVLTPQEITQLIKIMHGLVAKGKTIIIITHKLKEIMESADACTIIRRGKYMGTVDVSKTHRRGACVQDGWPSREPHRREGPCQARRDGPLGQGPAREGCPRDRAGMRPQH